MTGRTESQTSVSVDDRSPWQQPKPNRAWTTGYFGPATLRDHRVHGLRGKTFIKNPTRIRSGKDAARG